MALNWGSLSFALLSTLVFSTPAAAQVAITVGVQEMYDDNIFLENDERRPAPLVVDDALEEDLSDGELSVFSSEQADGNPFATDPPFMLVVIAVFLCWLLFKCAIHWKIKAREKIVCEDIKKGLNSQDNKD